MAYEVCPRCEGHGTVGNPAFDGLSVVEMQEEWGDEDTSEFLEEYTRRGGMYDVLCDMCGGDRVVTPEQIEAAEEKAAFYAEWQAEMNYGY